MINYVVLQEIAESEAREWDTRAAMPAIWEIIHHCENAGLKIQHVQTIVNWYVFLKKANATTLEEFLQKFSECAEKKDFYEFSKYCFKLYHQVHEKQFAEETDLLIKAVMQRRMENTIKMERLGDQCHKDSQNDYWQRKASMGAPREEELPGAHVRLVESYGRFEDFMAAHKEFDKTDGQVSPAVDANTKKIAREVHGALEK